MLLEEVVMTNPKDKIQSKAVSLSEIHRFICLEWSTGTGKTLAAIKIVKNILKNKPNATGYLICKESTHKKNWQDDIKKHNMVDVGNSMKTILYASLKNQKIKADFVVLDECHALTPLRIDALKNILQKGVQIIFLSATIPDEKKQLMNSLCRGIYYDTISLNRAFDLKLLPEPSLVVHKVYLNDKIIDNKYWEFCARKPKDKKSDLYKYCTHESMYAVMKSTPKTHGVICRGTHQEPQNQL